MEVVMTTGVIRRAKLLSNRHPNKPTPSFFYRLDILPVTQPTVSEHWREMTDKWLLIVISNIFIEELEVFQSEG